MAGSPILIVLFWSVLSLLRDFLVVYSVGVVISLFQLLGTVIKCGNPDGSVCLRTWGAGGGGNVIV